VKASKIGLAAAADAQRSRATKQFMETALT
jgi:hypothetical protein